jgi:hypothetical protein
LAKSIFKKYWSTDLYFLQDRKTKMNLKKGQLIIGLRLKTDIYIYIYIYIFELKTVLLNRSKVWVLQDSDQACDKRHNYAHWIPIKEFLGDNIVMKGLVKCGLPSLMK